MIEKSSLQRRERYTGNGLRNALQDSSSFNNFSGFYNLHFLGSIDLDINDTAHLNL